MEDQLEDAFKNTDFGLDIEKVLNARLIELNSLSKEIKQKGNKLSLQRIPRYMRRRAASHNPKRVPSKFVKYPSSTPIGNSVVKERRRKQRKKHVNKLKKSQSIKRRNLKENRILLHIWFRKRFSLINELNYLIPLRNNTKNFRNLHKASIKQCSFYYRPLNKLLEIKFNDQQQIKEAFSLMKGLFNSSNLDDCYDKELDLFFYKDNKCLAPISILLHSELVIWISIPVNFYSLINRTLNDLFSSINLKFTIYDYQYERFRLIGSKAIQYLELLLNNSSSNQTDDISLNDLFETTKQFKIITNSKFIDKNLNASVTILIKDKIKSILDVLVTKKLAKKFWYNLVKNKGHLVGGKIDYEYYALQNDYICYPSIGYLDLPVLNENQKFELLKALLSQMDNEEFEISAQLIRSNDFLKLCESPIENADQISQFYETSIERHSLINAKLQAIKKGILEEHDLIYLPIKEDLIKLNKMIKMSKEEKIANQLIDDQCPTEKVKLKQLKIDPTYSQKELLSVLNQSSRKVIGVIEIGKFCLKSGRSEAFGTICAEHLIELINLNRECNFKTTLNVLTRSSNSDKFRFCLMNIKNFRTF